MSLARKHATSEPKAPSQLQPKRAQHIDHVLLKALAKRPEERYLDIQTFFAELSAPPPLVSLTSSAEAMLPTTPVPQTQQTASTLIGVAVTEALPPQLAFPAGIEVLPPQQAFPSSLAGGEQSLEQPPVSQQAFLDSPAIFEQETIQQASRPALPASLAIFEQETMRQMPVEAVSMAVVPGMHEASTVTFSAPPSPLADPRQPLPDSAQGRAQQATWRAYAQRARGTSSLSLRQVWLAAGLVALAMIVSISGIAIFFALSAANHTQSQAQTGGVTTAVAPTSPASRVSPAVTATVTTTPTQPPVTPTVSHPTPTPAPSTGLSCHVGFSLSSQWPGGFVARVTITNTGAGDVNGWTLAFTFPGGQQITNGWNGKFTQNGSQVSIANADFNSLLAAGSSVSPGFQATSPNGNLKPRSFSLNGVPCR